MQFYIKSVKYEKLMNNIACFVLPVLQGVYNGFRSNRQEAQYTVYPL